MIIYIYWKTYYILILNTNLNVDTRLVRLVDYLLA